MATFVEISIVVEARHGAEVLRDLDHVVSRAGIEVVAVEADHGNVARSAFSPFRKFSATVRFSVGARSGPIGRNETPTPANMSDQ